MKPGDRFVYVGSGQRGCAPLWLGCAPLWQHTGRITADGSRGGDGPPCWHVRFDDGRTTVVSPEEIAPHSAVDQLGELAKGSDG